MTENSVNNRGITLLYVLMALMAISFIGLNLIKLAGNDAKSGAYYGANESSRMAVISGFNASSDFFRADKNSVEFDAIMNVIKSHAFTSDPSSLPDSVTWLIGDNSGYISIPGSKSAFRAQLQGLDPDNFIVHIKVDAAGRAGSHSEGSALYVLDGLESYTDTIFSTILDTVVIPISAMRLGGDTDFESNCDLTVTGVAYLSGKLTTRDITLTFNGPFIQTKGDYTTNFSNSKSVEIFNGPTYFGGHLQWNGDGPTFNDKVGFDGGVAGGTPPTFNGDIYHNGNITTDFSTNAAVFIGWGKQWDLDNNDLYSVYSLYNNGVVDEMTYLDAIATNVNNVNRSTSPYDIPSALGLDTTLPELMLDETVLNSVAPQIIVGSATATDINNAHAAAVATGDTLCGGFAVVKVTGVTNSKVMIRTTGDSIRTRVVFVWDINQSLEQVPECTDQANLIIYSKTTNSTLRFGGFEYMRGVLFVGGAGFEFQPQNKAVATIDGATYYADGARHYNTTGEGIHYKTNNAVLQEISCMGLIKYVGSGSGATDSTVVIDTIIQELRLKSGYTHIEPRLISQTY